MSITKALPLPNEILQAHSQQLLALIITEIQQQGAITFARFMELALYAPHLGYYRSGLQKFGEYGDFTTAPELSPLFTDCLARQCQQILQSINQGVILEYGAGGGTMAARLLTTLAEQNCLPAHYYILEISAELKQRQQEYLLQKIPQFFSQITWLDQLPSTPIKGIILANEVIDAMPVHKFGWLEGKLCEYYVAWKQGQLHWHIDIPSDQRLSDQIAALNIDFNDGYTSEINLLLPGWIASNADILQQGLMLLIDYGFPSQEYYHPQRDQGTLMCHFQHHAHSNPLILPGIQDITAHVDFTTIAHCALTNQLDVSGYTHQAGFLLNCGIHELLPAHADPQTHYTLAQHIKRLTLPSEMGEIFKVIALTKNCELPLIGFKQFNQLQKIAPMTIL